MTELRDQKAATSTMADLDDAELLGFEWLESRARRRGPDRRCDCPSLQQERV